MENVNSFSPEQLKAPFILRCAALSIDYILFVLLPVGWLIFSKALGESGPGAAIGGTVWFLGSVLFVLNFIALPLLRGQTIGKMLVGLTIVNKDGTPVSLGTVLLRNVVGYFLTCVTLGIGFLISALNKSGRSLHDFVAGTIVVRARKVRL
jgi:uncharacterized RDD family membrane protein YckC